MKIYLVDWSYNHFRKEQCPWYRALHAAFPTAFDAHLTISGNDPPLNVLVYNDQSAVIFAHSNGGEQKWRDKANEVGTRCHIVLVRGGGGQKPESNTKGNLHGCFWPPSDFEATGDSSIRAEVAEICRQLNGDAASQVDWRLLQPAPCEDILALRLLCEAWLYVDRGTNTQLTSPLKTPRAPNEWFAPFGRTASDEAATEIGGRMGESAKTIAIAFLKEIVCLSGEQHPVAGHGSHLKFARRVQDVILALRCAAQ